MLINDKDAIARLSSPMNLMNRLRRESSANKKNSAMSLFGIGKKPELKEQVEEITVTFNPFIKKEECQTSLSPQPEKSEVPQTPTLDNILEDHEAQVKLGLAHDRALNLLNLSVEMLSTKLDDIKADKLPAVISAASRTVEGIRKERLELIKNGGEREVHYHFYTPVQKTIANYEVVDVT